MRFCRVIPNVVLSLGEDRTAADYHSSQIPERQEKREGIPPPNFSISRTLRRKRGEGRIISLAYLEQEDKRKRKQLPSFYLSRGGQWWAFFVRSTLKKKKKVFLRRILSHPLDHERGVKKGKK